MVLCIGDQFIGRFGATRQDHILQQCAERRLDILVRDRCRRVHNTHIHALADGVIEEDGVHGLAHVVVAAEGEREVADATADLRPGQVLLDPTDGADEIQSVAVVLGHTRCDGQDVGVEDDVLRREASLLGEQSVGALTDGDLTLEDVRLTRLVEGHHDRSGP